MKTGSYEEMEDLLGAPLEITRAADKYNWLPNLTLWVGTLCIGLIGLGLQNILGFGKDTILWLIFGAVVTTGKMLLGGQTGLNTTHDILVAIHRAQKKRKQNLDDSL